MHVKYSQFTLVLVHCYVILPHHPPSIPPVVLGNAYFAVFFSSNQDHRLLQQCSNAYTQAVCQYNSFLNIIHLLHTS